jgi:hypothetical protein
MVTTESTGPIRRRIRTFTGPIKEKELQCNMQIGYVESAAWLSG